MCIIKHQLHVITVIHTNVFMIFIIQPMLYTQEQVFFFGSYYGEIHVYGS